MKKVCFVQALFTLIFVSTAILSFAQSTLKEYSIGGMYRVSLPDYMIQVTGINDNASAQFKSAEKGIVGFIIEDNIEDLKMVKISYASINEFYASFIKDFATDQEKRVVSAPVSKEVGGVNFLELLVF